VQYAIPDHVPLSPECRELLSRIFVGDPAQVGFLLSFDSTRMVHAGEFRGCYVVHQNYTCIRLCKWFVDFVGYFHNLM
jgi:hypothetical protein